jgi:hypothetical protein
MSQYREIVGSQTAPTVGKENEMDAYETILLTLGQIQGEFVEIRKLNERVARLEMWQSWLKGGWVAIAYAYLWKTTFGH